MTVRWECQYVLLSLPIATAAELVRHFFVLFSFSQVSDFQPEKGFAVLQGFLAGDFHTHSRNTTNDNQSQKLAKTQRLRLHHTRRSGKQ